MQVNVKVKISQLLILPISTTRAIIHMWKEHHLTIKLLHTGSPHKISNQEVRRVAQKPRTTQSSRKTCKQQVQSSQRNQQPMNLTLKIPHIQSELWRWKHHGMRLFLFSLYIEGTINGAMHQEIHEMNLLPFARTMI